jgi:hypothetical protein
MFNEEDEVAGVATQQLTEAVAIKEQINRVLDKY